MERGLGMLLGWVVLGGCAPTGSPLLELASEPASIRGASAARVTARATNAKGEVGKGAVHFVSSAGSLTGGKDVALDAFGTARVDASCDLNADSRCHNAFRVVATWEQVTTEQRVVIEPPPPAHETFCDDGKDNDEDGAVDCADADCEGFSCTDGLLCTIGERCRAGACTDGSPRDCNTPPSLYCASGAGTCDPGLGCVYPPRNTGSLCDDGLRCTTGDRCDAQGRCTGTPKTCESSTACYLRQGQCNEDTGTCEFQKQRDGTSCGTTLSWRCCDGSCKNISADTQNCGGCGVSCSGRCDDASTQPSGCTGADWNVSGRCSCAGNIGCPPSHDCKDGACTPVSCRPFQERKWPGDACFSWCEY